MFDTTNECFLELLTYTKAGPAALKRVLKNQGYSESVRGFKTMICKKTGFSLPYVGRVMEGKIKISVSFLERLIEVFEIDINNFNRTACALYVSEHGGDTTAVMSEIAKCFGTTIAVVQSIVATHDLPLSVKSDSIFDDTFKLQDLICRFDEIINELLLKECGNHGIKFLDKMGKQIGVLQDTLTAFEYIERKRIRGEQRSNNKKGKDLSTATAAPDFSKHE